MTVKQVIGRILYNSIAKHMPLSDARFSFGSKRVRAFCGKLILENCGKNVNIEKGASLVLQSLWEITRVLVHTLRYPQMLSLGKML